ncbi:MAG TPA: nucleoside deaminase [Pirellulales bacterium]|nr:nucleoside deaminase [Pirellulales bacterium]
MIAPNELMQLAIAKCREGIAQGQTPFGCAIALGDRVLAVEHNRVLLSTDITAHAEMTALRAACRELGDIHLHDALVATTCEPCPMCLAALHWARVGQVYYGTSIADAQAAGFNELPIAATEMVRLGRSRLELHAGLLPDECRQLFTEWTGRPGHRAY